MDAVLNQRDRRGGAAEGAWSFVAHHFEQLQPGMQRFTDQQLERSFRGFDFVALVLHLLDAFQQFAARGFQTLFQAVLLQFVKDVARPERSLSRTRWRLPMVFGLTCS